MPLKSITGTGLSNIEGQASQTSYSGTINDSATELVIEVDDGAILTSVSIQGDSSIVVPEPVNNIYTITGLSNYTLTGGVTVVLEITDNSENYEYNINYEYTGNKWLGGVNLTGANDNVAVASFYDGSTEVDGHDVGASSPAKMQINTTNRKFTVSSVSVNGTSITVPEGWEATGWVYDFENVVIVDGESAHDNVIVVGVTDGDTSKTYTATMKYEP